MLVSMRTQDVIRLVATLREEAAVLEESYRVPGTNRYIPKIVGRDVARRRRWADNIDRQVKAWLRR